MEVFSGSHEDLYDELRSGKADIVLNDQRRAFSDLYINQILTTAASCVELSARSPLAGKESLTARDLRNLPCILATSSDQRENEMTYYRDIVGLEGEFLLASDLEQAHLLVVGGRGCLPVEGAPLNAIAPGIIVTPLAVDEFNGPRGDSYKNMFAKCPAGRPGTADEEVNAAELLMSGRGAFITGYRSKFLESDPEFVERFDNFAFDEVVNQVRLDGRTAMMSRLAYLLGCQGIDEFRAMLPAALKFGVTPVEIKEIVYQAVAYLGMGRVFPFLHAVNDVLTQQGMALPL